MLTGTAVLLRARLESDVATLHAGLYEDVASRSRSDARPWRPIPPGPSSPFRVREDDDRSAEAFSVIELATGELAGAAVLWAIDTHNRLGHAGLSLLPAFRGRGLGRDVLRVLCHYGFTIRGLHRMQLETLADNEAMIGAALACGFRHEGTLRSNAWVSGQFLDEVIYGLIDDEWKAG
ncbi:MAG: GNAT family protein [Jatrophihabitantaceae bacterium]